MKLYKKLSQTDFGGYIIQTAGGIFNDIQQPTETEILIGCADVMYVYENMHALHPETEDTHTHTLQRNKKWHFEQS